MHGGRIPAYSDSSDAVRDPILPLLYLIYLLVRGAVVGWYPYPFLNPVAVGGYGVVSAYVIGIVCVFFGPVWLLFRLAGSRPV